MKVYFHPDFYQSYTYDPAAAIGRMEAIVNEIKDLAHFEEPEPASEEDIAACHGPQHINRVKREGLYDIAALAAGGAIAAAQVGLTEPAFALIRPPGHHASRDSAWGFCYFNNMAIAIEKLKRSGQIKTAKILDFDLHFGDGTVNILGGRRYVAILNPSAHNRNEYLKEVERFLFQDKTDIIGISAGFDNHLEDWGGLLHTDDYRQMGKMVREAARSGGGGCFAILEGGYNHRVLGKNCRALLEGLLT
ncbi:MAG: histone deacetylase family protein [Syntrophales bacterium]|nr:histone deacetylase family protein [Syntrophales bacterium]